MLYKMGPMAKTFFNYARKTAIVSSVIDRPTINRELSRLKNKGATYKHLEKCRDIIERKKINDLPKLIDALVDLLHKAPKITPEELRVSMEGMREFQNNNLKDEVPLLVNSLGKIINAQIYKPEDLARFAEGAFISITEDASFLPGKDNVTYFSKKLEILTEYFLSPENEVDNGEIVTPDFEDDEVCGDVETIIYPGTSQEPRIDGKYWDF